MSCFKFDLAYNDQENTHKEILTPKWDSLQINLSQFCLDIQSISL
jgi:hypothetical protein